MRNSKLLISQALKTISGNLERTGDPLGLRSPYWTRWTRRIDLPRHGSPLLFTARMYQMLPFVVQATEMAEKAAPLVPALSVKTIAKVVEIAGAAAAEPILRLRARRARDLRNRAETALAGIVAALAAAGILPGYLYEKEPYSGVLLYDLGMEAAAASAARGVHQTLKEAGVDTVITVDPHTTFMLRQVYPRYIPGFRLPVRHYLEVLAGVGAMPKPLRRTGLPVRIVMHDSCVMTRDLGVVAPARTVLSRLGIEVVEPENTKTDTACCGGPVEYAFADLSRSISCIRAAELAGACRNVLVACPICLINLMKHEKDLGIRVWDMGELLFHAFASRLREAAPQRPSEEPDGKGAAGVRAARI
ncbi:MAG: (Fe-S)-binding protein [Desulfobacteraceae bacterium]|nr:(Fe-S)-binding protein [Desulfobacteraceae bacterium]